MAVTALSRNEKRLRPIAGSAPSLSEIPVGCAFAPRCGISNQYLRTGNSYQRKRNATGPVPDHEGNDNYVCRRRKPPGEAAIGVFCQKGSETVSLAEYKANRKNEIFSISKRIGITTNNVAEYEALIAGLSECKKLNIKPDKVYLDSELVVKQNQR